MNYVAFAAAGTLGAFTSGVGGAFIRGGFGAGAAATGIGGGVAGLATC